MKLCAKELIDYVNSKEWKEWRSRKEFDEYLLKELRWDIIGYVTHKTLDKWDRTIDFRGLINKENMYILQLGYKYYFLTFRALNGFTYRK